MKKTDKVVVLALISSFIISAITYVLHDQNIISNMMGMIILVIQYSFFGYFIYIYPKKHKD